MKHNAEFMDALNAIAKERGIDKQMLLDTIEQALISAFKKNFGTSQNVKVSIDNDTGAIAVYALKSVVEEVNDPAVEISVADAKKQKQYYEAGDILEIEVTPRTFGRIAAQTAKQVVVQRIREAERGVIYDEYIEKENEIMTAIVQRVEGKQVFVELSRTEGLLDGSQHIPGEEYAPGDRVKVYVLEVLRTNKGPQVLVSRTHSGLVKRLFEIESPEILSGVVQIKAITREAGYRTKMAVASSDPNVDPIGSCVGPKGIRVEKIVSELKGEKIDIIKWSADPAEFIANALSPAKVVSVFINEGEKAAKVIVPNNQLSLAIGKEGQNARLAAKLTGWKIDIKSYAQMEEAMGFDDEDIDEESYAEEDQI
ncbi:MAG: transcription termination/antitermination protein NusA [Clostridiales bacterium]|nr:transcription termination/antitermination protein NusA [Clostridiales bacterium]MBQ2818720.1 transcription termination/antitermination protein NusA [Clostridia bacterium]MBQ4637889.1 transcription termination/antitermination protein NusA [Clostridia bacterium]